MLKDKRFAFLGITKSILSRLVNHGKITKKHFQRALSHENEGSPFSNNTLTHLLPMHSFSTP